MRIALFFVAAFALILPACGSSADVDTILMLDGDGDAGATVYAKQCVSCHGDMGQGGIGPALKTEAKNNSDDEIVTDVLDGIGSEMPSFRDQLSDQDVADLLAFIRRDFG